MRLSQEGLGGGGSGCKFLLGAPGAGRGLFLAIAGLLAFNRRNSANVPLAYSLKTVP